MIDRNQIQEHPQIQTSQAFSRCIGCRCTNCTQVKSYCQEIKKMLEEMSTKKVYEVLKQLNPDVSYGVHKDPGAWATGIREFEPQKSNIR